LSDNPLELLWATAALPVLGLNLGQIERKSPPHPDFEFVGNGQSAAIETVCYLSDQTQKNGEVAANKLGDEAYDFCVSRDGMRGIGVDVELDKARLSHSQRASFIAKVVATAEAQTLRRVRYVVDGVPVTTTRCDVPHILRWDTSYDCAWTDPVDEAIARAIDKKVKIKHETTATMICLVVHPGPDHSQRIGDLDTLIGKMPKTLDVLGNQNKFCAVVILNDRGQSMVMRPGQPVVHRSYTAPTLAEIYEAAG
jgi:hypothetical protein